MSQADRYTPIDGAAIHLICALCKEVVYTNVTHVCKNVKPVPVDLLLLNATGEKVGSVEIQHVDEEYK